MGTEAEVRMWSVQKDALGTRLVGRDTAVENQGPAPSGRMT